MTPPASHDLRVPVTVWGPAAYSPRRPAGYRHIALGLFLGIVVFPFIPAVLFILISGGTSTEAMTDFFSQSGIGVVSGLVFLWAGLLVGVWAAARRTTGGFRALVDWKFSWKDPLIAVVFVAAVMAVNFGLSWILEQLGVTGLNDMGNTGTFTGIEGPWRVAVILGACIGAPIVEEIFFRGLTLRVTMSTLPTWLAVLVTSLLFGLMHVQANLASSVYMVTVTAGIGILLALLRLRTGRLGTSISAHVLFNSANLALALVVAGS